LQRKGNDLLVRHIQALRQAAKDVKARHPFKIHGWVTLPEHLHFMIELPEEDADYTTRLMLLKMGVSKTLPKAERRSVVRVSPRERGIWQRRYWEHLIRDEADYLAHLVYIHYKPVKHGWVKQVKNWPYSTFHHWVRQGVYPLDWGDFEGDWYDGIIRRTARWLVRLRPYI